MGHLFIAAQLFQLAGCFGYDFFLGALASGLRQPPPSIEGDGPLKSHTDAEVFQPMLEAAHDFVVVLAYGKGFRHHVLVMPGVPESSFESISSCPSNEVTVE